MKEADKSPSVLAWADSGHWRNFSGWLLLARCGHSGFAAFGVRIGQRISIVANAIQELPASLLSRAVQSSPGCEYAWRLEDIPQVIETARFLNLVSVGGQLQFRLPDGTCECYWVEVNTYQSVDKTLPWSERVDSTAEVALRDFNALQQRYDFMAEGMVAFAPYLNALIEKGEEPAAFMCFVWYVLSEADEKAS